MNRYASVFIFLLLVVSAAAGSVGNYYATKKHIVDTLNVALQRTIAENEATWLAQDTIVNYKRMQKRVSAPLSLRMRDDAVCQYMGSRMRDALRGKTYVELLIADQRNNEKELGGDYLCSDSVLLSDVQAGGGTQSVGIAVRGVAQCSMATVFSMSDQRLPFVLFLMSVSWAVFAFRRTSRLSLFPVVGREREPERAVQIQSIGGIFFRNEAFFDKEEEEIHLTPMQRKLLTMFFNSPDHKLLQADICNSLWPKKEDASETLYALITRTKKVIEQRCGIKIEVDRGRGYSLISNE